MTVQHPRDRIERHSATWIAISEWAASERRRAIERALKPGLDHVATEALRARVALLDELIRLPDQDLIAASLAVTSGGYAIDAGR